MRHFFLTCALLLASCFSLQAEEIELGVLTVQISKVDIRKGGTLHVALFESKDGWPKLKAAAKSYQLLATEEIIEVQFADLPYAQSYAVEIHHDENDNGKFDMRWFPYPRPKEGVGVSNNKFGFGPPDFTDARFSLDSPQKSINIQMYY